MVVSQLSCWVRGHLAQAVELGCVRTWRPADVNVLGVADDGGGQCSVSLAQEALRCEPQVCAGTEEAEFSQTLARDPAPSG